MRTETTTRTLYLFDELSEDEKNAAIEKLWDLNVDHDWWDVVYMDAEDIGLKIHGFDLDRHDIEGRFTRAANEVAQNIINNHGDMCETYKTAKAFMNDWEPIFTAYMDETSADYESRESEEKMLDLESEFLHSLLEDYWIMLRKEYEYMTSEEAIKETIEANEYEFTEAGELA